MPVNTRRRRGFTLGEVLISVAILAILAALTMPTVSHELTKGNPSQAAGDLFAMRDGMNRFVSDVGRYPGAVDQLVRPIWTKVAKTPYLLGSATTCVANCLSYGISDSLRWRGPYVNKDTSYVRTTGFGWTIDNPITAAQMAITGYDPSNASGTQMWAILTIQNVDTLDWEALDKLYDDGLATSGAIRWTSTGTTPKMLKFLAIPIS
jgi:prepilin-type N-terminal cleavage/methylation domain-containing protein